MKVGIFNLYPEVNKVTEGDIKFFEDKFGGEAVVINNLKGLEIEDGVEFDVVISFNTTALFQPQILQEVRNGNKLMSLIENGERYIYKKDKHFSGIEFIQNCKFKEVLMTPKKKVMIAIPCFSYTHWQTMKSVYDLIIPEDVEVELHFMTGYTVVQARNRLVKLSLENGFDYTLFVDSDVILPQHLLMSLLLIDAEIVTGWYIKKIPGTPQGQGITELYGPDKLSQQRMVNIYESELPKDGRAIPIKGCGFGCTLVKNSLFSEIDNQIKNNLWFEYIENQKEVSCSEDLDFCIKAEKVGGRIVAHTGLRCSHIGTATF